MIVVDYLFCQFKRIARDELSDDIDDLHNESPDSLYDRELQRFAGQFGEQAADGLVRFKALDRTQNIVLYHA